MQPPSDPVHRATRHQGGSPLATPAGAASLAVILVALVAVIVLVPGMLAPPGPTASPAPGTASAAPSTTAGEPATSSPPASFVRPTPTPPPTPTAQPAFRSYTIRAGDTLASIARAFGTTARSLAWWNRGTYPSLDPESAAYDPNHIEVGWVLVLIPGVVVDDANPPTPSPGPATPFPTASASPGAGPTPVAGGPAAVVSHGSRGTTQVALTFDMGGRLDPAVAIVQWLVDHDVRATLFPTGKSGTTTDEGRSALRLAATRLDLFTIGNHSWDHPDFTALTAAGIADQLQSTEDAIRGLIGGSTAPWFRPPYGAWNAAVREGVGAAGWSAIVMWDVDTIDWKSTADGGPTAEDIVTKVLDNARGGSIVLMHLGGWHTLEALPDIVAGLRARDLTPVTLAEMLGG